MSISGIELLGVMYLRFPLAHGYFHGKFGAIERLNLLRAQDYVGYGPPRSFQTLGEPLSGRAKN